MSQTPEVLSIVTVAVLAASAMPYLTILGVPKHAYLHLPSSDIQRHKDLPYYGSNVMSVTTATATGGS